MILPFTYSIKDALLDLLGYIICRQIPEETLNKLGNLYLVDKPGIALYSIAIFLFGLILGRITMSAKHKT